MFGHIRDNLTSMAAKRILTSRLERYGKVTSLQLNRREKTVCLELQLLGEDFSVTINIERYQIIHRNQGYAMVVESVTASRPWLQNLLEDKMVQKPFKIPPLALQALGSPEV